MALLYAKQLVFPRERALADGIKHHLHEYTTIPLDIERAASPASEHSTLCDTEESSPFDEKTSLPATEPSTLRDARIVSDAIIGLSDGLTVPFALSAGLSALGDTNIVIYGGLAELFAGAISMGLGGYLGSRSEW